jgi:hypothetical protein
MRNLHNSLYVRLDNDPHFLLYYVYNEKRRENEIIRISKRG